MQTGKLQKKYFPNGHYKREKAEKVLPAIKLEGGGAGEALIALPLSIFFFRLPCLHSPEKFGDKLSKTFI